MSNLLVKRSIQAAVDKFDDLAKRTFESCDKARQFVSDYNELSRTQDYNSAKRIFDKFAELGEKYKFVGKFSPIKNPEASADWFSRKIGSVGVIKQAKSAIKHVKLISAGSVAGAGFFALFPGLSPKIGLWLAGAGLAGYATVASVVAIFVLAPYALSIKKTLKMHEDTNFDSLARQKYTELVEKAGEANGVITPELQKEIAAYDKAYVRDFTTKQTTVISEGLKLGLSESFMVNNMSSDQRKTVEGIARTLRDDFFVPDHLLVAATLTMLVEKDGNSKAVKAMLNSRILDKSLIERFEIDPLSTVGGKRKETDHSADSSMSF